MTDPGPTRTQGDLAEMLETLLDKGVVINADVAVTVGDAELLGIQLRAAIASFETAAEYGLEFPGGTDLERVREAAGVEEPRAAGADGEPIQVAGRDVDGRDLEGDDDRARELEDADASGGSPEP